MNDLEIVRETLIYLRNSVDQQMPVLRAQLIIEIAIAERDTLRQNELAKKLRTSIATVSRALKQLTKEGTPEKHDRPAKSGYDIITLVKDGRTNRILLTANGRRIQRELRTLFGI